MRKEVSTKRSAIVCLPGFRQTDGPSSGIHRIYAALCERYYDRRRDLVLLRTWDSNHAENAALIQWHNPERIIVVGYSYGCGHALSTLALELAALGRDIDYAYLIDPVPRHFWGFKWVSLTRMGRYSVPPNVKSVMTWRQLNGAPYGRNVKTHAPTLRVVYGTERNIEKHADDDERERYIDDHMDHMLIDDDLRIRTAVLDHIESHMEVAV